MKYFKSGQPIPGSGVAWTYSETDDNESVTRMLTYVDATGAITRFDKPRIKKLIQPERLEQVDEAEFTNLWSKE